MLVSFAVWKRPQLIAVYIDRYTLVTDAVKILEVVAVAGLLGHRSDEGLDGTS